MTSTHLLKRADFIFKNDKNVKELKLSAVNLGNLNKIMDNFDEFLQK